MKKIIASAVGLMLAGGVAATTASAVESQFGGYWRTRMYVQDNYDGVDSSAISVTDTRTRLYYTAKFSDDFKFVNKFEWNSTWGDNVGGDIGTDGMGIFRIKHSYIDVDFGNVNVKVGMQGWAPAKGAIFDDDFAGIKVAAKFGNVTFPVTYAMVDSEDADLDGNGDRHVIMVDPIIKISDMVTVTPHVAYETRTETKRDIYWVGAEVDVKMDAVSFWGMGLYNGGEVGGTDVNAFLLAAGVDAGIVHGNAFYASGDDDAADNDQEAFQTISPYYVWAEIMGPGMIDTNSSNNAPGGDLSNTWAANVGVTVAPMDKMSVSFDVWYAQLAEEIMVGASMEDELGLEFDGKVSYKIMDNLNADFVLAYLVSGDATGDEDAMEAALRLSLSF